MAGLEESWRTGPPGDRGRYLVADPEPLPGGQGFVYSARRRLPDGTGQWVALKLLGELDAAAEASLRERWDAVRDNPHDHLVEPLELFRGPGLVAGPVEPADDDSNLLYAVTSWVPGASLRQAAPLEPAAVATLVTDLADALGHLHSTCGLVHRDVHPGNVIVDPDGHATLIDLGAARPRGSAIATTVAGVLGFIPPERSTGPGDHRSDAWALGMTAIYALLGHPQGSMTRADLDDELRGRLAGTPEARRAIGLLSDAIVADPDLRPEDLPEWARVLSSTLIPPARPRRRRRALVGIGALAALGIVLAGANLSDQAPGDTPAPIAEEQMAIAADGGPAAKIRDEASFACQSVFDVRSGADAELVRLADAKAEQLAEVLGSACTAGEASRLGDALVQPVMDGSAEDVVVAGPAATVRLTEAQWASFRQVGGREHAERAVEVAGWPQEVRLPTASIGSDVELSLGGHLIGPRADSQSFLLAPPVLAEWERSGGASGRLGLPMTNAYVFDGSLRQEFEHGHLRLSPDPSVALAQLDPATIELHLVVEPGAALQDLDLNARIVRQRSGTAWYVNADRQRRWIVDDTTFDCLGGERVVVADDLAGATVATLPLGAPIKRTCGT